VRFRSAFLLFWVALTPLIFNSNAFSWDQVSISSTSLHNAQNCQHNVIGAKVAVLFYQYLLRNFICYFRLQLFHRAAYFRAILPFAVAMQGIKNYLRKSCTALLQKMLVKLTQGIGIE
jgi:hypothetical protein